MFTVVAHVDVTPLSVFVPEIQDTIHANQLPDVAVREFVVTDVPFAWPW